ncbi:hypothetical protein C1646_821672 [Rhizophagus diaphanus]|nr:hypothetical protein C1646_821672 [Rhizophagus diaphanus] [Rhizophagus sp. MUCL 43196]
MAERHNFRIRKRNKKSYPWENNILTQISSDTIRDAWTLLWTQAFRPSRKMDHHSAKSGFETSNCESNVLERDLEKKRNDKSTKNGNDTNYQNVLTKEKLNQLEQLLRVGSLRGYDWTDEIPSKSCRFVHAHPLPTKKNRKELIDTFEESVRSRIATIIECKVRPNNTNLMAYPLGSLEEMPNDHPVEDIAWFEEDGIVYEELQRTFNIIMYLRHFAIYS